MKKINLLLVCILIATIVIGSELKTKTLIVSQFNAIEAGSVFEIDIKKGATQKLIVEANEKYIDLVTAQIRNGVLILEFLNKNFFKNNDVFLKIHLTMTEDLRMLKLSGASKLSCTDLISVPELNIEISGAADAMLNITCKKLNLDASGASHIILTGSLDEAIFYASGACKVNAKKLNCNTANIEASGASSISVNSINSLTVKASGASSVKYLSKPAQINVKSSGASHIKMI